MAAVLTSPHDVDVGLWGRPLRDTAGWFGAFSFLHLPAVGTRTGLQRLFWCLNGYFADFFSSQFDLGLCVGRLAPCPMEPGSASSIADLPSAWKQEHAAHSICIQFESVEFDIVFARLYIVWDTRRSNRWRTWKIAKLALHLPLAEPTDFMNIWRRWALDHPLQWGGEGAPVYEFGVQMDGGDWPTPGMLPEGLPDRYSRLWPDISHMIQRHALQALQRPMEEEDPCAFV